MAQKILVTGGAGYIGSHACKLLAKAGYEPVVYDNFSTGHREFVKWGPVVLGDIRDKKILEQAFVQFTPSAVMHFAGSSYVGESVINPMKYYLNNVLGSITLFEVMQKYGVKKLIFSSSCATYGGCIKEGLINEKTAQMPINPYGQSKLMVEKILSDLSQRDMIDFVGLRYFNAAGADQDSEIGEWHFPETHLIPLAIESSYLGAILLKIYGTDFDTIDGTAVRDYVHVEDIAVGHLKALHHLEAGGNSDFINLGSGKGTSVYQIVDSLKKLGIDSRYEISEKRLGDPPFLVADIQKAKRVINWSPDYQDILMILRTAINWDQKLRLDHLNQAR
jgi:UDP-glucose 4-epimerase